MTIADDQKWGRLLRDSCTFVRESIQILKSDPEQVVLDQKFGRALAVGSTDFVMKGVLSTVPDFREMDQTSSISPQNLARRELYFKRLSEAGFDPEDMERRTKKGFTFRAKKQGAKPKFKAQDRSGVRPLKLVV